MYSVRDLRLLVTTVPPTFYTSVQEQKERSNNVTEQFRAWNMPVTSV